MKAKTNLQKVLSQGGFAVTCEYNPPCGTQVDLILKSASLLKGKVHAVNVSDNSTARVMMSSWALSKLLLDAGLEPVIQMVTRDRNRIALQSDLLGASAMGIQNVLCLTGDHTTTGDHPEAKKVFDIDSIQWIAAVKQIRDQGTLMNGKKITGDPAFFVGAAANPFVGNLELHILRLQKKVAAGAQFVQTQPVFDLASFEAWFNLVMEKEIIDQCPIIAGVLALKSAAVARHLRKSVPGIMIPDAILDRLSSVGEARQLDEGIKICIENIHALKETKGVRGVHIMAIGCEDKLPTIIDQSGVLWGS